MKFATPIVTLICTGILIGAAGSLSLAQSAVPRVCDAGSCVSVEAVSKTADLERGLMFRSALAPDKGMLFIFAQQARQSFWMKNMHFNLDMLWINNQRRIVFIGKDVPACVQDPCPIYTPVEPARYVLEVNAGYTKLHGWKIGDRLQLEGILQK